MTLLASKAGSSSSSSSRTVVFCSSACSFFLASQNCYSYTVKHVVFPWISLTTTVLLLKLIEVCTNTTHASFKLYCNFDSFHILPPTAFKLLRICNFEYKVKLTLVFLQTLLLLKKCNSKKKSTGPFLRPLSRSLRSKFQINLSFFFSIINCPFFNQATSVTLKRHMDFLN
jgi:hypothetical protein